MLGISHGNVPQIFHDHIFVWWESIKHYTHYFSIINIKNFGSNNIKINEKSYKIIRTYYIGSVTIKNLKN